MLYVLMCDKFGINSDRFYLKSELVNDWIVIGLGW